MKTIRVAGVPEHFNLPWQNAIQAGAFEAVGIDLQWTMVPEGTGRLCQLLQDNEIDLAVILTEGLIKSIHQGNPARIVQKYVQSPLLWGVHVSATSSYQTEEELRGKKVAISRYGSGSELMAYVHADQFNWPKSSLQFEVVNTLDGAIEALTDQKADYFLWEQFMTQPVVDRGIFRRLGVCPTPWPSFVLAATEYCLNTQAAEIELIRDTINAFTKTFKTNQEETILQIVDTYGQLPKNIENWLALTEWATEPFTEAEIDHVQDQMMHYSLVDTKLEAKQILG